MEKGESGGPRDVVIAYTKSAFRMRLKQSKTILPVLEFLEQDLRDTGGLPFARGWKSFGEVRLTSGVNALHCHLNRKCVAIWKRVVEKTRIVCEFIYIGSREKAPY